MRTSTRKKITSSMEYIKVLTSLDNVCRYAHKNIFTEDRSFLKPPIVEESFRIYGNDFPNEWAPECAVPSNSILILYDVRAAPSGGCNAMRALPSLSSPITHFSKTPCDSSHPSILRAFALPFTAMSWRSYFLKSALSKDSPSPTFPSEV